MYNVRRYFYINILVKKVRVIVEVLRYLIADRSKYSHISKNAEISTLSCCCFST